MFEEKFNVSLKSYQFAFIDNGVEDPKENSEEIELREFEKSLKEIESFIDNSEPFFC